MPNCGTTTTVNTSDNPIHPLLPFCSQPFSVTLTTGSNWCVFPSYSSAFPVCHINTVMQYLAFESVVFHLTQCIRVSYIVLCVSMLLFFFFIAEEYFIKWIYLTSSIPQLKDVWIVSSFRWTMIMKKVVMHIHIQVFVWTCFHFSWRDIQKWDCCVIW